jgi:hypothetical protein
MMSQAWLRGRTVPNNLAGTTAGRDVASQGLWNLPNASSAVDDVLVGEGFRSNLPYYLGLTGMIGGAGTFLASEYVKNNPTPVDPVITTYYPTQTPVVPEQNNSETDISQTETQPVAAAVTPAND